MDFVHVASVENTHTICVVVVAAVVVWLVEVVNGGESGWWY